MSLKPRKLAAMVALISAVLVLAGCDLKAEETEQVKADAPLISKIEKGEPTPLEEIVGENTDALELTSATVDPYEGDEYLVYVNQAKQRDRDSRDEGTAGTIGGLTEALAAAVVSITEGLVDGMTGMFDEMGQAIADDSEPEDTVIDDGGLEVADDESSEVADDESSEVADDESSEGDGVADEESSGSRYVSASDGFSILFPDGWQLKEETDDDKNRVVAESEAADENDGFLENIAVEIEELPLEMDLEEYTDMVITAFETDLSNFTEVGRSEVTLDSAKAKKVIYTYTSGSRTLKAMVHVVPNGLKGYTITSSAEKDKFSSFQEQFAAAAQSFKFE